MLNNKLSIIYKKVEELIPYVNNPRNNKDAIDKVASSIKNFGFKVPLVIDSQNEVITGHTRLLASKKLGIEEVPVIVADDLSEAQIKAFRIADNKVSEYAEWDMDLLKIELEELEEMNFDYDFGFYLGDDIDDELDLSGFDDDDEDDHDNSTDDSGDNYIIQYNIIFNDEEEKDTWYKFMKYLKETYSEQETISAMLTQYINEAGVI